jgi:hypothetical protein
MYDGIGRELLIEAQGGHHILGLRAHALGVILHRVQ